MNEAFILAGATLISGILIVSNEWLKRYLDNNHKKKKFKLWGKIYNTGVGGEKFLQPDPILYELLENGLIELEISWGGQRFRYPRLRERFQTPDVKKICPQRQITC